MAGIAEILIVVVLFGVFIILPIWLVYKLQKKNANSLRAEWNAMSREEQMKVKYTERQWNCPIPLSWPIKDLT